MVEYAGISTVTIAIAGDVTINVHLVKAAKMADASVLLDKVTATISALTQATTMLIVGSVKSSVLLDKIVPMAPAAVLRVRSIVAIDA